MTYYQKKSKTKSSKYFNQRSTHQGVPFYYGVIYIRLDRQGAHRQAYDRNRKILLKTQNTCGICGHPVNINIKSPDPLSPTIDHIIPVSKGGHPSDINNLQLTHRQCNRQKSDKMFNEPQQEKKVIGNRNLPQTLNWTQYKS